MLVGLNEPVQAGVLVESALNIEGVALRAAIELDDAEAILESLEDLRPLLGMASEHSETAAGLRGMLSTALLGMADAAVQEGLRGTAIERLGQALHVNPLAAQAVAAKARDELVFQQLAAERAEANQQADDRDDSADADEDVRLPEFDAEATLDAAYLLLETAPMIEGPQESLELAKRMVERVLAMEGGIGDSEVCIRAKVFLQMLAQAAAASESAQAASSSSSSSITELPSFEAIKDTSEFKYKDLISKAKTFDKAKVIHYTSAGGHQLSKEQRETVHDFAEKVTQLTMTATYELLRCDFSDWNRDGSHLVQMLNLQEDWGTAGGDKAKFYDLQKLRTLQADKPLESGKYNRELTRDLEAAGWGKDDFSEDDFLERRAQKHSENPDSKAYAEQRSLNMLHKVAGYLVEERTYQLMPSRDEVPWTDQDTEILGAGTRPDIVLSISSEPRLAALLDITASDSQGHIFDKQPRWTNSLKVCDSIEILYPSMDHATLFSVMLEKKSFTKEEIERRREAVRAREEEKMAARQKARQEILTILGKLGANAFRLLVGGRTPANHLLKSQGVVRKGFNKSMALKADTAAAAQAKLDAWLQEQIMH